VESQQTRRARVGLPLGKGMHHLVQSIAVERRKGRTIRKVMGGVPKKNSRKGKLRKKIHAQRVAQKKSSRIQAPPPPPPP